MSPPVPAGLAWWRTRPEGTAWLDQLPALIDTACARWSLTITSRFEAPTMIGFVAAVRRADGSPAVLKLNAPDPESEHEASALALWAGRGAVRLLERHAADRALLLERCTPGTPLSDVADDDEALRITASMLRRLWASPGAAHPFRLLVDEARRWAAELPVTFDRLGRPFEPELLDLFVGACRDLTADPVEPVVLHQDLHGGNILRAEREPWLVIDPKPLVGDRAFDIASVVRDRGDALVGPDGPRILRRRLDLLADELGLDRDRMRLWSLVHALAWGIEEGADHFDPEMVHIARLLGTA